MFLDHTQRRTTVGMTPLDERSARRRDLYLTTHDTHNRQISMPPVGFEPTISAGERPSKNQVEMFKVYLQKAYFKKFHNFQFILLTFPVLVPNLLKKFQLH